MSQQSFVVEDDMKLKNKNNPRVRCEVSYNTFRHILKPEIEQAFKNFREEKLQNNFPDNNNLETEFYKDLKENFNNHTDSELRIISI